MLNDSADFEEFWAFYVGEHRKESTRQLHFLGTTAGIVLALDGHVLAGVIIAYGLAWVGHFFVEKNKPATWKYPLMSFRADFRMYAMMLRGEMTREVRRLGLEEA